MSVAAGGNGRVGREWHTLAPLLSTALGSDHDLKEAFTLRPGHAKELTREAIKDGASVVVAVGGDGTLNEVVNGFFQDGRAVVPDNRESDEPPTALGLIAIGTGSDFGRTFGWSGEAPQESIRRVARNTRRAIDVGRIEFPQEGTEHYFVNEALKFKALGGLCYLLGTVLAFQGFRDTSIRTRVDGGEWESVRHLTTLAIANGQFFGGGLKIAPSAGVDSRRLEVVTFVRWTWFRFLVHVLRFFAGTHYALPGCTHQSVRRIQVEPTGDARDILVEAEGQLAGKLPAVFTVLPQAIDFLV
eukprot:jgi/Mesen1/10142/ME000076S09649